MNPPPKKGQRRRANSDGGPTEGSSTFGMKKVVFDEIMIKEYPIILGDHPAVYVWFATRKYGQLPPYCRC